MANKQKSAQNTPPVQSAQASLPGTKKNEGLQLAEVKIQQLEILHRKLEDIGQLAMTAKLQMFNLFEAYRRYNGIRQVNFKDAKIEEQDKRIKERAVESWDQAAKSAAVHLEALRGEVDEALRIISK